MTSDKKRDSNERDPQCGSERPVDSESRPIDSQTRPIVQSSSPARPTGRGTVRGALVAVHNLTTLLESPRVARATVDEVLPEALGGVSVLRRVFFDSAVSPARGRLRKFVDATLDRFESAAVDFRTGARGARERLAFERVASEAAHELDVAGELLELACRTGESQPTHLAADETLRYALASGFDFVAPARATALVADIGVKDCTVFYDAFVLRRLFALLVAEGIAWDESPPSGTPLVLLEPACAERTITLTVRRVRSSEATLREVAVRTFRTIEPSRAILEETAARVGGSVIARGEELELSLPRSFVLP